MNIWLTMVVAGLLTFATRFSFVWLFGRYEVPTALRRALHFVPPAALSAIALPELFLRDGTLALGFDNIRLLAGLAAILVAWYGKNSLLTILAGILVLIVLQLLRSKIVF